MTKDVAEKNANNPEGGGATFCAPCIVLNLHTLFLPLRNELGIETWQFLGQVPRADKVSPRVLGRPANVGQQMATVVGDDSRETVARFWPLCRTNNTWGAINTVYNYVAMS